MFQSTTSHQPHSAGTASETLITVVMVMQNDQKIITETVTQTANLLSQSFRYFEILVVDNGSVDQSVETVKQLQLRIPNIRLLVLSRKYDQEIAFAAALDNSVGDYVVLMDIQFDPPALMPELLAKAQSGFDIVIAERNDRSDNTWTEKIFARFFYRIYGNISGFYFSPNASYFRVLSRRAVNSIIKIKNKSRYLKYFNALVGFTQTYVKYDRVYKKDAKQTKVGFVRSLVKASDVIVSNTVMPLRLVSLLGVVASFLSLLFLIYVFVVSLIKDKVAEGWISSSVMNASMFFLVFLFLTVISEYISRILIESKDQPLYFIADEYNSKVLQTSQEKINVV
ncbi:MAG: glycosyltransferase [Patescibacteria group bacterium]